MSRVFNKALKGPRCPDLGLQEGDFEKVPQYINIYIHIYIYRQGKRHAELLQASVCAAIVGV